MNKRYLGKGKLKVSAIGFGCMSLTGSYGEVQETEAVAVVHKAIDLGITFFDTADVYGAGTNEHILGKALKGRRSKVIIATKFGFVTNSEGRSIGVDCRPETVKKSCEGSLKRLGVDFIDLYYQHRIDPSTPVEETVNAMAELVKEGKVRFLGLSEASAETIRRANSVYPITALQSDYSICEREVEANILPTCRELGTGFVAYKPLASGLLTGRIQTFADVQNKGGYEFKIIPRLSSPEFFEKNLVAVKVIQEIAQKKGCTTSQVALAWVLAQGSDVVALPGTKHIKYLEENSMALDIKITEEDKLNLDKIAASIVGDRFSAAAMGRVRGQQEWNS
jgi:aryl-alcohol dehydrogenase-like predicted oxidoreductase